jgi:hypothetical protein
MYLQIKDRIAVPSTNIGNHSNLQQKISNGSGTDSSGGIAAGCLPGFNSRQGQRDFLYVTASRTALGLTQNPIPRAPGVLSPQGIPAEA